MDKPSLTHNYGPEFGTGSIRKWQIHFASHQKQEYLVSILNSVIWQSGQIPVYHRKFRELDRLQFSGFMKILATNGKLEPQHSICKDKSKIINFVQRAQFSLATAKLCKCKEDSICVVLQICGTNIFQSIHTLGCI